MSTDAEQRPSYRTLNEPTKLIGLSVGGWLTVIVAGGIAYAVLTTSPLPWRVNFSAVAVGLGAPVFLLLLREPGTIGPGRLLLAVLAWRLRPVRVHAQLADEPVRRGGVRLDEAVGIHDEPALVSDLPWAGRAAR